MSAIPARGIEDVFVCSQSVDGEVFQQFLCQCVLPIILPFNGNNPRSIVVMDNQGRVQDYLKGGAIYRAMRACKILTTPIKNCATPT